MGCVNEGYSPPTPLDAEGPCMNENTTVKECLGVHGLVISLQVSLLKYQVSICILVSYGNRRLSDKVLNIATTIKCGNV